MREFSENQRSPSDFRFVGRFVLLMAAIVLATSFASALAAEDDKPRMWVDRQGRDIKARFIRVHDGNAVLKRGNRSQQIPLRDLSDADQKYIADKLIADDLARKAKKGEGYRTWTDRDGDRLNAKLGELLDGDVTLLDGEKAQSVPFKKLAPGDQEFVRLQIADEEAAGLPASSSVSPTAEERVWTNTAGEETHATLVRYSNREIILYRAGEYIAVRWATLSKADQEFVRAQLAEFEEEAMLPRIYVPRVASAAPIPGQPNRTPLNPEALRRARERQEQLRREREEVMAQVARADARNGKAMRLKRERDYAKHVAQQEADLNRPRPEVEQLAIGPSTHQKCMRCRQYYKGDYCPECPRHPYAHLWKYFLGCMLLAAVGVGTFAVIWYKINFFR